MIIKTALVTQNNVKLATVPWATLKPKSFRIPLDLSQSENLLDSNLKPAANEQQGKGAFP